MELCPSTPHSKQQHRGGGRSSVNPTLSQHHPHRMATALPPTPAVRSHAVCCGRWGPRPQRGISRVGMARGRKPWPRPRRAWLRQQSPAQHTVIFLCLLDNLLSAPAEQDPAPKSQCSAGSRDGSSRDRGQRVWAAGIGVARQWQQHRGAVRTQGLRRNR